MSKIKVLRDYDTRYVPPPTGRQNNGVICYFNALDAVLKSIPIFNKAMMDIQEHEESPLTFCTIYAKEVIKCLDAQPGTIITNTSLSSVLKTMVKIHEENKHDSDPSPTKTKPFHLDLGQCDPSEALIKLLDVLGETYPSIKKIFQYRHTETIRCETCKKITKKETSSEYVVHNIQSLKQPPSYKIDSNHDLFVYNLICSINELEGQWCPICNGWRKTYDDKNDLEPKNKSEEMKASFIKSNAIISHTLNLIPEIMVINLVTKNIGLFNRQENRIKFPLNFRINKKNNDNDYIHYKLVGQIHKSGNNTGGHYWARCLRKGMVYKIDDSRLAESEFEPTSDTTMVFYHHFIPTESDPFIIED